MIKYQKQQVYTINLPTNTLGWNLPTSKGSKLIMFKWFRGMSVKSIIFQSWTTKYILETMTGWFKGEIVIGNLEFFHDVGLSNNKCRLVLWNQMW